MMLPPPLLNAYLVRIWFGDDDLAWRDLVTTLATPDSDGFLAGIDPVSDPRFDGASPEQIRAAIIDQPGMVIFMIADETTLTTPGWPVLVLSLLDPVTNKPFRSTAQALPIVENNLWLGNVGWWDFEVWLDAEGIFRGYA